MANFNADETISRGMPFDASAKLDSISYNYFGLLLETTLAANLTVGWESLDSLFLSSFVNINDSFANFFDSIFTGNLVDGFGLPFDVVSQITFNFIENNTLFNSCISANLFNYINGYGEINNILLIALCNKFVLLGIPHSYLSSFTRFFGQNSRQDATKIYIDKANLSRLSLSANNSAESLFAALIAQAFEQESNYLISKVFVEFVQKKWLVRNSINYENTVFEITFFYPYENSMYPSSIKTLTPNDY